MTATPEKPSKPGRTGRYGRWSGWLRGGRSAAGAGPASRQDLLLAAAGAGLPLAPAAHPSGYGCSCDRVGCPTPGRHPVSLAWQTQASTDTQRVADWARVLADANFITATGIAHDVLDVPAEAGRLALAALRAAAERDPLGVADPAAAQVGPVAAYGTDRLLFFTATRAPADEDEWWPCELDCHPETLADHPGLRWHCRASYVLVPPSVLPDGTVVSWLDGLGPDRPLPDPLPLLTYLTDACGRVAHEPETAGWPA